VKSDRPTRTRYTIDALARGLEVLALFGAERPALTLRDIVDASGLNKTTAFRIVATLEALGYLEQDERRRYRPGARVLELGFAALSGMELRQLARPHLERLAHELDETASLAVLSRERRDIIYIDRVRNRSIVGVVLGVGSHLPAHSAALGKVLLADMAPSEIDAWLAGAELAPLTKRTLVDRAALLEDLGRIRRRGYALNEQELAIGLRAAAAPIYDASRRAIAAIGVSGTTTTITPTRLLEQIGPAVADAAARIARAVGYGGPPCAGPTDE
jgi:IclR family pca regulon transcriptional regulator